MINFKATSDTGILQILGDRLKQERLNQNLTQERLAEQSGVSVIVVKRAEAGMGCTMNNFIKILRSLSKLESLDLFLPEPGLSPIALAQRAGRRRKEASGSRGRPPKSAR